MSVLSNEYVEEDIKKILYSEIVGEEEESRLYNIKNLLTILFAVFIVVGVAGIAFIAPSIPPPFMKIKDIGPNGENPFLNYAIVKVRGTVVRVPSISYSQGKISLYFTIEDDTGSIDVRAYDPVASEILHSGKIPLPGYVFEGEVQVRVRETYTYLIIQSVNTYVLETKYDKPVYVSSLSTNMEQGMLVTVSGLPENLRNVSSGWLFDLRTGKDTVTVLIPEFIKYIDPVKADWIYGNLSIGAKFNITGVVYFYREASPEVVPRSIDDIVYMPMNITEKLWLHEVLSNIDQYKEQLITIKAYLDRIYYVSGKYILKVYDTESSTNMSIDRDALINAFNPLNIGSDTLFELNVYVTMDGEFVVKSMSPVRMVETQYMEINSITPDLRGRIIRIAGVIDEVRTTSGGSMIITLRDNTGSITVFIPSSTIKKMSSDTVSLLDTGKTVTMAGYVDIYGGKVEVVVYHPDSVFESTISISPTTSATTTTTPPPSNISINELNNHIGSQVVVDARIKNMSYQGKPIYRYIIWIYDNTGETIVNTTSTVVEAIDPSHVGIDSLIRVEGTVEQIDNTLYIDASSITVIKAVEPPIVEISDLNLSSIGLIIGVNGTITDNRLTSGGAVITLSDGTGLLSIFIPNKVWNSLPSDTRNKLETTGTRVVFYGYLTLYKGSLELVVYHVNGVLLSGG